MTMKLALIGHPVAHSQSPALYDAMFRRLGLEGSSYNLVDTAPEELSRERLLRLVDKLGLAGFNVTVPHKVAVRPMLDEVSDEARAIGAVNTVVVRDGRLYGYNTDAGAFSESLVPHLQPCHTNALILGTGGAARAVAYALGQLGIEYLYVSRCPKGKDTVPYSEALRLADAYKLVVNATPVGMLPLQALSPWPDASVLGPSHLCYDLVYTPSPTRFLAEAAARGAAVVDGKEMLRLQAEHSIKLFMGMFFSPTDCKRF